tara:strand:- start:108333 stop:108974 length:642 start_codon:yes stop_codon:yes gene_type:complete
MYKLVLYENNDKLKVLYNYSRRKDATYRLKSLTSKKVSLKKEVVYKNKELKDVSYRILLTKKREEGDKSVVVRDGYGKILEKIMNDPNEVVISVSDYEIEEQYSVTGANRKLSASEILNSVLLNKISEKNTKQVLMLNNKLIIDSLVINMVTCKDVSEVIRLYNYLRKLCWDKSIPNVVFFGEVHKQDKGLWYKRIHEQTGVSYNRLYRKISR